MSAPANLPENILGTRLRTEIKRSGMSAADIAKTADVKLSFLYDVISGKSANPSTLKLMRVASVLQVSLAYLVGTSDNPAPDTAQLASGMPGDDYATIPRILVDVSAGGGTLVTQEQPGESYHFRKDWIRDRLGVAPSDLRMLYVRGDSMEPALCHNDIVLVDTTKKHPSPPGIFVLFDGFGLVAKRVEYVADAPSPTLRILSENPLYDSYERSLEDSFIVGRIVWFAREI